MDPRPSPIAGHWYPAEPATLTREIERYLGLAEALVPPERVVALVVPHAGLQYSGPVAAWAFACARGLRPDVVALVGPFHRGAATPLLTSAHGAYATPLGHVPVDHAGLARLELALHRRLGYGLRAIREDGEHALEIELPFLQLVLQPFRLLPVMLAEQRPQVAAALGHALAEALHGQHALMIASSDLSHYFPQHIARALDETILSPLAAFEPDGVLAAGAELACGPGAIAAILWAARDLGATRVTIVRQASSGDVTGDYDSVVGYAAAVIHR